ncbi:sulfotransferase ssu-1-like [Dermacentor andersoni]|uniref:sulfotransferase ssu-1-like n=1 Tax=Dermacentor andersoni TaxID=34620 RepID=UPI002154F9D0|nr:sulfotransferase ssu-1-like [Dermacentor andersoni]XP_054928331.1 sulfotransferase ssu-1-like [Dermacentor andersoni]
MDVESYRDVAGVWLHNAFREENVRSAIQYKPREGDIFIVTYPKCGTNWVQFIVYNILTRAKPLPSLREFGLLSPFIDMIGAEAADNPSRNGPIMTHLPPNVLQPVKGCKYIYVTRNPYDCAVSFYHFIKGFTLKTVTDVSFESFLSMFLSGKVIYGDYFDHLLPWYDRRAEENVLFLTYEQLTQDTRGQVLKIADFLGDDHGAALRKDEALFQRILDACSLESMKAFFKDPPAERIKEIAKAVTEISLTSTEPLNRHPDRNIDKHDGAGFVRKGIVGDWKNYFTPEQLEKTKAWIASKTSGSDVMELWRELDLP